MIWDQNIKKIDLILLKKYGFYDNKIWTLRIKYCIEAFESKWVNSDYIQHEVNSLRLGGLHIDYNFY